MTGVQTCALPISFSYHQDEDYLNARSSAQRFLDFYQADDEAAYAQYLLALSYYDQMDQIGNDQAVAGATLVVPLGTLLSEGLKISVDDGPLKVYNYAFCAIGGCFARVGFTEQDIESFKAGNTAKLTIVPAQAPDQVVEITASLSGFTAAFNEVTVVPN